MYRFIFASRIALLALAFGTIGLHANSKSAKPGQTYSNREKGFGITMPGGWEMKRDVMGAVVVAISPLKGPKDVFRENVNVVVEDLNGPMTSKEYYTNSMKVLKQLFKDFKLEKQGVVKIDKHDFHFSVFSHRLGETRAKVLQYMAVNGKRAYVVTCSATPDAYKNYQARFEDTVKSFKFEDGKGLASSKEK